MKSIATAAGKGAIKALAKGGGKSFAQYKAVRGGTQTLEFIKTTNATGQVVQ